MSDVPENRPAQENDANSFIRAATAALENVGKVEQPTDHTKMMSRWRVDAVGADIDGQVNRHTKPLQEPTAYSEMRLMWNEKAAEGEPAYTLVERVKTVEDAKPVDHVRGVFVDEDAALRAFGEQSRDGYRMTEKLAIEARQLRNEFVARENTQGQNDPIESYRQYREMSRTQGNGHDVVMEADAGADRMALAIATDPRQMQRADEALKREVLDRACNVKDHHLEPADRVLKAQHDATLQRACEANAADTTDRVEVKPDPKTERVRDLIESTYEDARKFQKADPETRRQIEEQAVTRLKLAPSHQRAEIAMAHNLTNSEHGSLHRTAVRWEAAATGELGAKEEATRAYAMQEMRGTDRGAGIVRALNLAAVAPAERGKMMPMFHEMTERDKDLQRRHIESRPGILNDPKTTFAPNGAMIDKSYPLSYYRQHSGRTGQAPTGDQLKVTPPGPATLRRAFEEADKLALKYGSVVHPAVRRELNKIAGEVLKGEPAEGGRTPQWTPERDAEIRAKIGANPAPKMVQEQIDQLKTGQAIEKDPVAAYIRARQDYVYAASKSDYDLSAKSDMRIAERRALSLAQQIDKDPSLVAKAVASKEAGHMSKLLQKHRVPVQNLPGASGPQKSNDDPTKPGPQKGKGIELE